MPEKGKYLYKNKRCTLEYKHELNTLEYEHEVNYTHWVWDAAPNLMLFITTL